MWRHLNLLLFAVPCFAEKPESPLIVRPLAVIESDGGVRTVNVSVGNRSAIALGPVTVSLVPGGIASWTVPQLAAGEWKNGTISLGSGNPRSLAAVAEYSVGKRSDSLAEMVVLPEPQKPWWSSLGPAAIPVALGAIIGFAGVIITSFFTLKKERVTAELQWKRFLVERYDAPYRTFLTRAGGVLQADALKQRFTELDEAALVQDRLREAIRTGINAVELAADDAGKRAARDKFLAQVRSALLEPFQGK